MNIEFVNPEALWALFLLVLPVLIHLFSFKKFKQVEFSDIRLLKSIHSSGVAKKNLQSLLVLLSRVLMLACLIFTFAQPIKQLDGFNAGHAKVVSIYVDNSFSMSATSDQIELFDAAKLYAEKIVNSYSNSDRFQVLSNDYSLKDDRLWQKEEAKNRIAALTYSSVSKDLKNIYQRQNSLLADHTSYFPEIYWISDFQSLTDSSFLQYNTTAIHAVPLHADDYENITVDSVWFESPVRKLKGKERLKVQISNHKAVPITELKVDLEVNGKKYLTHVDVSAKSNQVFQMDFMIPKDDVVAGKVGVQDVPVTYDNDFYFAYQLPSQINVLSVSNNTGFQKLIKKVFGTDSSVSVQSLSSAALTKSALKDCDLLILGELDELSESLREMVKSYQENKGVLLVIPSDKIDVKSYNSLMRVVQGVVFDQLDTVSVELAKVDSELPFFEGVFDRQKTPDHVKVQMPVIRKRYGLKPLNSMFEKILSTALGNVYAYKNDQLLVLGSGLTSRNSDWEAHPLVVPLLYQLILGAVFENELFQQAGVVEKLDFQGLESQQLLVIDPKGEQFFATNNAAQKSDVPELIDQGVGEQRVDQKVDQKGWYRVVDPLLEDTIVIAINYSRQESEPIEKQLKLLEEAERKDGNLTLISAHDIRDGNVMELTKGAQYWHWCLRFAILFFLIELFLLWFYSFKKRIK